VLVAPVCRRAGGEQCVVGQVVEPKELIFEIIDPDSLHIEATAYDPLALDQVASATVAVGERSGSAELHRRAAPLARAGLAADFREPCNRAPA
jgi:hypothetical protein